MSRLSLVHPDRSVEALGVVQEALARAARDVGAVWPRNGLPADVAALVGSVEATLARLAKDVATERGSR